jgi:HD superfamily phosphohydrolase
VEEKGKYSIEKFLVSRRLMYWQVYLHKTSLSAEQMLIRTMQRAKELATEGKQLDVSAPFKDFLYNNYSTEDFKNDRKRLLDTFAKLDDFDIVSAMKSWISSEDSALSFLSERLINRKLFKTVLRNQPFEQEYINNLSSELNTRFKGQQIDLEYLLFEGSETNNAYSTSKNEINILFKDGTILPISAISEHGIQQKIITKHYLCYPK